MAKGKKTTKGHGDNIQDAIEDAAAKAVKTIKKTDAAIEWKLLKVSGTYGGITSSNSVQVKIEFSG